MTTSKQLYSDIDVDNLIQFCLDNDVRLSDLLDNGVVKERFPGDFVLLTRPFSKRKGISPRPKWAR